MGTYFQYRALKLVNSWWGSSLKKIAVDQQRPVPGYASRILGTILLVSLSTLSGYAQVGDEEKGAYHQKAVKMVEEQVIARGVTDDRVIEAMKRVPRHLFIPSGERDQAYGDHPLPIGEGQTISQPYVVAKMTELLKLKGNEKVLEIGTGSGYQAAILGRIAKEIHTVEIRESLARSAEETLEELGYSNVHVHLGNGYEGWSEEAPYDGIIVTAAPEKVPEALKEQLKVGGRLVIPVGETFQKLRVYEKKSEGSFEEKSVSSVQFVPMIKDTNERP